MVDERYRRQVQFLLRVMPMVAEEECLALKGGTAINLFLRELPRLSVDQDLTYVPVAGPEESLAAIDGAMRRIGAQVGRLLRRARVTEFGAAGRAPSPSW